MVSTLEYGGVKIRYLGHAGFRVEGEGCVLYIDPFRVKKSYNDAGLAICTHDHFDHCSPGDLLKVAKSGTVIVAAANCRSKLARLGFEKRFLKPGDSVSIGNVEVRAIPAYNVGKSFHPKDYGGIGVIVKVGNVSIYHAGDTDKIPEMEQARGVDIALLPVSGTYVMTADEAAEAVKTIMPKVAVPMHYGTIVGSEADARRFAELASGVCKVVVLTPE